MLTEIPIFLSETLHFKLDKAGFVAAMPYLIMSFFLYLIGYVSDVLTKNKLSYTFVRKLFCCLGEFFF